jgi:nucleotide-binding universal stress UspA family protein
MSVTKRVVIGLDGSDESRSALHWAVEQAAAWDAELDVVHAWDVPFALVPPPVNLASVTDIDELEQAAMALLETEVAAATTRAAKPRQVEKILVRDSAAKALLETAKGADLLIVGSRGRGGFSGLLLGSVSNQCVHHAPCPVVVVRGIAESPRRGPILVGIDGSECGHEALRWAIADASSKRRPVIALAAWSWLDQPGEFNPDYGAKDVQAMAEAAVARARQEANGGADVEIEIRVVNDHAAPALIDASRAVSLLVVGSRGLGGFRGLLLGSVSNKCVHHAHCPVAVVRT